MVVTADVAVTVDVVDAAEDVEEPVLELRREEPTLSSSPTGTPVSMLPRARSTSSSPRTLSPETLSTEKRYVRLLFELWIALTRSPSQRVTIASPGPDGVEIKTEYRVWNPFRSKLAAGILGGLDDIHVAPGKKVLYLGAASGTSVSHVADIVGPEGTVYAVEFSHRSGRDLINMAKKRTNVIPIVEDARYPNKYRMLLSQVDVIFADVAQPDQARIVALNAHHFLKNGGHVVVSVKASCIDSTAPAEAVFAAEVKRMQAENIKPHEQLTLGRSLCPLWLLEYFHSSITDERRRLQSPTRGTTPWSSDLTFATSRAFPLLVFIYSFSFYFVFRSSPFPALFLSLCTTSQASPSHLDGASPSSKRTRGQP